MRTIFYILITLSLLSFISLAVPVYPENEYLESRFPKNVQTFINELVDKKCVNSDYICGFYEEPVRTVENFTYYTVEIFLLDYEGTGFVTVLESKNGTLRIGDLTCPTFFK